MSHKHRSLPASVKAGIDRPPDVVRVRQVIEVEFRRGEGCCDDDPVRACTAYYTLEGELLAVTDPAVTFWCLPLPAAPEEQP